MKKDILDIIKYINTVNNENKFKKVDDDYIMNFIIYPWLEKDRFVFIDIIVINDFNFIQTDSHRLSENHIYGLLDYDLNLISLSEVNKIDFNIILKRGNYKLFQLFNIKSESPKYSRQRLLEKNNYLQINLSTYSQNLIEKLIVSIKHERSINVIIKFLYLVIELDALNNNKSDNKDLFDLFVNKTHEIIQSKPNMSIQEVSQKLDVSYRSLTYYYKKLTQKNLKETISNNKIEIAKNLLRENKNIKSIALTLGYEETQSFSRFFKLKTGINPSEYKKNTN